jgi:hypothetical protein
MIANAAFVATLIFLALGFWSMHDPHRKERALRRDTFALRR